MTRRKSGRHLPPALMIVLKQERPVAVQQEQQRAAQNGKQQQHGVLAASGGDIRVEEGEEDHRDPEQERHQSTGNAGGEGQARVPEP